MTDTPYTIEHVVAVDPLRPSLQRDVFMIVDESGVEQARAFTPEAAALVCAALSVSMMPPVSAHVHCPQCLGEESAVTDSRVHADGIVRRRKCLACGARYKTIELLVELTSPGDDVPDGP